MKFRDPKVDQVGGEGVEELGDLRETTNHSMKFDWPIWAESE